MHCLPGLCGSDLAAGSLVKSGILLHQCSFYSTCRSYDYSGMIRINIKSKDHCGSV